MKGGILALIKRSINIGNIILFIKYVILSFIIASISGILAATNNTAGLIIAIIILVVFQLSFFQYVKELKK